MIEHIGFIEQVSFQRIGRVSVQVNVKLESGIELGTVLSWDELHETFFHMAALNPMEFAHTPLDLVKCKWCPTILHHDEMNHVGVGEVHPETGMVEEYVHVCDACVARGMAPEPWPPLEEETDGE